MSVFGVEIIRPFESRRLTRASPVTAYCVRLVLAFVLAGSTRHNRTSSRTHDQTTMHLPLSSISRSDARIFCCSIEGAFGSKRPSFWFFFQAKTLSVRDSYSAVGIVYLGTEARSEKSVRAPGGRVSPTYGHYVRTRDMAASPSRHSSGRKNFAILVEEAQGTTKWECSISWGLKKEGL